MKKSETMSLQVQIPSDRRKLEQAIKALDCQILQNTDDKSKAIHIQTLDIFKKALSGGLANEQKNHNTYRATKY